MSVQERYSLLRLKKGLAENISDYHYNSKPKKRGSASLKHSFIETDCYVFFIELNTVNFFKVRHLLKSKLFEEYVATLCGEVMVWKNRLQGSTLIRIKIARKD